MIIKNKTLSYKTAGEYAFEDITDEVINFIKDKKLSLGEWQRIFLIELDHSRQRKVQMQVIGE